MEGLQQLVVAWLELAKPYCIGFSIGVSVCIIVRHL
jgi:hypothetical protein